MKIKIFLDSAYLLKLNDALFNLEQLESEY